MRMVTLVLRLTPYGVFAMMTKAVATTDVGSVLKLGKFVIASYAALLAMFAVHLVLLAIFRLNPLIYVKKALPILSFAFTSRSSAGTLPLNIQTQTNQHWACPRESPICPVPSGSRSDRTDAPEFIRRCSPS